MRHNDYNSYARNLKVFPKFNFCKDTKFNLTLKLSLCFGYIIGKNALQKKNYDGNTK
jgi:hypothetical protein